MSTDVAASAAAAAAAAASEIELLDKVLFRLGMSDTDEQLEKNVNTFLPPVLLKLQSESADVKKKVMEVLSHINKRVANRKRIKLPLPALFEQFSNAATLATSSSTSSSFMRNFTLIYIRMAISRLGAEECAEHVPSIFSCIASKNTLPPHRSMLYRVLFSSLAALKLPSVSGLSDIEAREQSLNALGMTHLTLGSTENELLSFFHDVLLCSQHTAINDSTEVGPGISLNAARAVGPQQGETSMTSEEFRDAKMGLLRLLSTGVFPASEIYLHYIVASADSHHSIVQKADTEIRRILVNIDDPELIGRFYNLYLGTLPPPPGVASLSVDDKRSAANVKVKLKIIAVLARSTAAASMFPQSIQVIFDALFAQGSGQRLAAVGMQMLHWVCEKAPSAQLRTMGPVLLSGLLKLIHAPASPLDSGIEMARLRGQAYVGVAKLSSRVPALVRDEPDLAILKTFLHAVENEDATTRVFVQEALSLMVSAYAGDGDIDEQRRGPPLLSHNCLIDLLMESAVSSSGPRRFAAMVYASRVFPFSDPAARYICVLGSCDTKSDVREEAMRGLSGPSPEELRTLELINRRRHSSGSRTLTDANLWPDFKAFIRLMCSRAHERMVGSGAPSGHVRYMSAAGSLPFSPAVFGEAVRFARQCLITMILARIGHSVPSTQEEFEVAYSRTAVREYLLEGTDNDIIDEYRLFLESGMGNAADGPLLAVCAGGLLEFVAALHSECVKHYRERIGWLQSFLFVTREETRESICQLIGLLAPDFEMKHLHELINFLISKTTSSNLEERTGAASAIGYVLSSCGRCDIQLDASLFERSIKALLLLANDSKVNLAISTAACQAIGEAGRFAPLAIADGNVDDSAVECCKGNIAFEVKPVSVTAGIPITKRTVVDVLSERLASGKEGRLLERSGFALGLLCKGDKLFPHRSAVLAALFNMSKSKFVEVVFALGESLSCVVSGTLSSAGKNPYVEDMIRDGNTIDNVCTKDNSMGLPENGDTVDWMHIVLVRIFNSLVPSPIKEQRRTAAIWLLSLLKHSADHTTIQRVLTDFQTAFGRLLGDSDEFTQEVASKGLGIVYEAQTDPTLREQLIHGLINSLVGGEFKQPGALVGSAAYVTADTTLFNDGALGKAPDGSGMSTYKDICNICTDLNQPDLIYKFLSLSRHNAMWNTRKGAAFGFASISRQASDQLRCHLGKLIPKLYRFQHDPNPNVQAAMKNIWDAILPPGESSALIISHLDAIITDLVNNMGERQWRTRESSCLAVVELLPGKQAHVEGSYSLIKWLDPLWRAGLKVMDDVKETVRKAAERTCRALSTFSIRVCEQTQGDIGRQCVGAVLPVLLENGILSRVEEIQRLTLNTTLRISKDAGPLMRPYTAVFVNALLEALSSLEPASLNYLSFHVNDRYGTSQDKLDQMRLAAARSSPLSEAVDSAIDHADTAALVDLIPKVIDLIRQGVGLPTKAGCARLIVQLCSSPKYLDALRQFSKPLLKILTYKLQDRSGAVRYAYSSAIGHLCRHSSDTSITRLFTALNEMYANGCRDDDDAARRVAGQTMLEISKHANDSLKGLLCSVIPVVFIAKYDAVTETKNIWNDVWNDVAPGGAEAAIRLYLIEILDGVEPLLEAQSWFTKRQASEAIVEIVGVSNVTMETSSMNRFKALLPPLLTIVSGKLFDGKEHLLNALVAVAVAVNVSNDMFINIVAVIVKECTRPQKMYLRDALKHLVKLIRGIKQDCLNAVLPMLLKHIEGTDYSKDDDDDDDDDVEKARSRPLRLLIRTEAIECLVASVENASSASLSMNGRMNTIFRVICHAARHGVWNVRVAALSCLSSLLSRRNDCDVSEPEVVVSALVSCMNDGKYSVVRLGAVEASSVLFNDNKYDGHDSFSALISAIHTLATNDPVDDVKIRSMDLLKRIKQ